ncbi:hypothetical protein KBC85_03540, partial [Candidatus Saccharibacteria bacterium]|nr:hypothetical protein [Candidatus Saccharibacteria bacterium]
GFSIPFFGNKNRSKVKLGSGSKINKKFALIPIALIAVFGSYLIVSSFAASPVTQGNYGLFTPLDSERILDTRDKTGITKGASVGPNQTIDVQVAGKGGIPESNVSAVVLNVTAVVPSAVGYATIWAKGSNKPETSNINYNPKQSVSNSVTVRVGENGKVRLHNNSEGSTNYVIDVVGYYSTQNVPLEFAGPKPTVVTSNKKIDPTKSIYTLNANDYLIAKNEQIDLFKRGILDPKLVESSHLNKIINSGQYQTIIFPKLILDGKVEPWEINPIFITRDNIKIELSEGATVQAKKRHPDATGLINSTRGNRGIEIEGNYATLRMNRDDYPPILYDNKWSSSEFRALIVFRSVKDGSIKNINLEGAAGDGITIGSYDKWSNPSPNTYRPPRYPSNLKETEKNPYVNYNIAIENVHVINAARNGISAGNVDGLTIKDSFISGTNGKTTSNNGKSLREYDNNKPEIGNKLNIGPWAGIDFEPNYALEPFKNIVIEKTKFLNNVGGSIQVVVSQYNDDNLKNQDWSTLPTAYEDEENKVRIPSGKETYMKYSDTIPGQSNKFPAPFGITVKDSIMGMTNNYYDFQEDIEEKKSTDYNGQIFYKGPNYKKNDVWYIGGNVRGTIVFDNCGINQLPKALGTTPIKSLPALVQYYRPGNPNDIFFPSINMNNTNITLVQDKKELIRYTYTNTALDTIKKPEL